MLKIDRRGRLLIGIVVATFIFVLSRSWTTQLATRPMKPVTTNSCPAEFFVVAQKPDGQYALMAVFDYSDELKSYFYRESSDRNKTRLLLQATWPTAEILWPDDSDVNLQLSKANIGAAENHLNTSLAENHEKLGLYPTVITFRIDSVDRLSSGAKYRLVIERGHFPEIYLYDVDDGEVVPDAYILENRLGGVLVSSFLGAVGLLLVQLLSPPLERLLKSYSGGRLGDIDSHK